MAEVLTVLLDLIQRTLPYQPLVLVSEISYWVNNKHAYAHYVVTKLRIVTIFVTVELTDMAMMRILATASANVPNLHTDSTEQRKIGGYVIPVLLFVF